MSDSVQPHRWQPIRLSRPWDSPGKNTVVGCHFLLQCMKGKSESEVAQSCPTLSDPMDCSLPGSSVHGIFQARVLEWGAIAWRCPKWQSQLEKRWSQQAARKTSPVCIQKVWTGYRLAEGSRSAVQPALCGLLVTWPESRLRPGWKKL